MRLHTDVSVLKWKPVILQMYYVEKGVTDTQQHAATRIFILRHFSRMMSGFSVYSVIFYYFKYWTVNHPWLLFDAVYCFRWDAHRPGQPSLANLIHRCISGVYATDKMQYCHKILRNIKFLIDVLIKPVVYFLIQYKQLFKNGYKNNMDRRVISIAYCCYSRT